VLDDTEGLHKRRDRHGRAGRTGVLGISADRLLRINPDCF